MPFTFNGIGTKYYGEREFLEDGSFVTTEWFVFVYVPIIPIGSFRVVPTGKSSNLLVYRSSQYLVKRVPINWRQVRNVYIVTVATFGAISGAIGLLGRTSSSTSSSVSTPSQTTLPSPVPSYIRPIVADNGSPFPSTSGYISGYPQ